MRARGRAVRVVIAGATVVLATAGVAIAAAGDLDTTFAKQGERVVDLPGNSYGGAVALGPHSSLYMAGQSYRHDSPYSDFELVHLSRDGNVDQSFGHNGHVFTDFNDGRDSGNAVVVLPDGRIVVVGSAESAQGTNLYRFALACYRPDGKLSKKFSGDGRLTTRYPGQVSAGADAAGIDGRGRIVAGGYAKDAGDNLTFALARYTGTGKRTPSFDGDGGVVTALPAGGIDDEIYGLALAGSKPVAVGQSEQGSGIVFLAVARYRSDGSLDKQFSDDGSALVAFGGSVYNAAYGVALDSLGRIVAVGETDGPSTVDWALARYRRNGKPDKSFDDDGFERESFTAPYASDYANDVATGPGNSLLVAGTSQQTTADFALARFQSGGGLDPSFSPSGTPGIAFTDFNGFADRANAMLIQPSGRIVVAGRSVHSGDVNDQDLALAGYIGPQ